MFGSAEHGSWHMLQQNSCNIVKFHAALKERKVSEGSVLVWLRGSFEYICSAHYGPVPVAD